MNLESDIYDLLCGRASARVCNAIQKYEGIKQIKDLIKEDGSFVGGLGKPPKIPDMGKKSIRELEYIRRWFVENHLQGTEKDLVLRHKYFKKDLLTTAFSLLQSYKKDVEYWTDIGHDKGVDQYNYFTNGSPFWAEGEEDKMEDYRNFVVNFVEVLRIDIVGRKS
tara:strand:+ start:654 stop:1148 length:495 start_codon:yes stop_codon:yes gene_type:complete